MTGVVKVAEYGRGVAPDVTRRPLIGWVAELERYIQFDPESVFTRDAAIDLGYRTVDGPQDVHQVKIQAGSRFVDLMAMQPGDFDYPAIARTLSRLPRFNAWSVEGRGEPWSVAQHCVIMCLLAISRRVEGPVYLGHDVIPDIARRPNTHPMATVAREAGLLALIHDAPEAYTGDLCSPIKAWCPQFSDIEDAVFEAMLTDLDFWPTLRVVDEIKAMDKAVCNGEARAIFADPFWASAQDPCWDLVQQVPCWTREEAEFAWLRLFEVLR